MKKIRNLLMWYYMFTKRLFRRYSFILILLLIPVIVPVARVALSRESGIMNVALCSEGEDNIMANEIINSLKEKDSIVRYTDYKTPQEARYAVQAQKAIAAWIFEKDLEQRMDEFVAGDVKPLVTVVAREDTTAVKLTNELLFASIFPDIAYESFKYYVYQNVIPADTPESVVRKHYNSLVTDDSIVKIVKLDSETEVQMDKNYLIAPIRGILSLLIVLCGIAAAMYFLTDQAEGKYDWLSYKKRLAPAFGSCFAAIATASLAVLVAIYVSGISLGSRFEIPAMILYVFAVTGFSLVLCTVFRSAGRLGAAMPFFIIIMLVLCPVFFNVKFLFSVRFLLPPHYYLNAVTDTDYLIYMALYAACAYALAYILNIILNSKGRNISQL